jgi:hypothetical protein
MGSSYFADLRQFSLAERSFPFFGTRRMLLTTISHHIIISSDLAVSSSNRQIAGDEFS